MASSPAAVAAVTVGVAVEGVGEACFIDSFLKYGLSQLEFFGCMGLIF